jgi:F0F1-type ATP synthase beta subunit
MLPKLMVCLAQVVLTLLVSLFLFINWCVFFWTGGFSVFAGVGERTREGNDLYREMIESGVIKLGEKQVFNSFW